MQPTKQKRSELGLTLMESLMGIMVIGVIITAISPPLVIAFATRIQNYRTQNAMKIAQGEIDRVRLLVEAGNYSNGWTLKLPPSVGQTGAGQFDLDSVVRAPDPNLNQGTCPQVNVQGGVSTSSWCTVDINGDGANNWDLAVQTFRSSTPANAYDKAGKQPIAFIMGVRVYTRSAIEANPSELKALPKRDTAIGFAGGRKALQLPLVTRYEIITRSDLDISRSTYCELSQNLPGGNAGINCD